MLQTHFTKQVERKCLSVGTGPAGLQAKYVAVSLASGYCLYDFG